MVVGLLADGMEQRITSAEWQDLLGGIILLALIVLFFYMLIKHGIARAGEPCAGMLEYGDE